jgi:hypothetical protein
MNDHTEYQLSEIDSGPLERLAIDLLTRQNKYQGIDPQGKRGKDGGKDGLLLSNPEGETVILHVSRRSDWDTKLEKDLAKTVEHDRSYDTVIFLTNRSIPGTQKPTPDIAQKFVTEHNWVIDLWDKQRLRAELDNNHQDLREQHLRIARDDPPAKQAERLIAERLRLVTQRAPELPEAVYDGPVAVLHLVPHEAAVGGNEFAVEDLPNVITPGPGGKSFDRTLDGVVGYDPGRSPGSMDPQRRYIYLDRDGWIEFVTTNPFVREEQYIPGEQFEKYLLEAYRYARDTLQGLEFDGPFEVCVSLLGVDGYSFVASGGGPRIRSGSGVIRPHNVEGRPYTIDDSDVSDHQALKKGFDRTWRSARWDGSPHYTNDGEWQP